MSPSRAWSERSRSRAMPSTSCSAPTCAMRACCETGSTSSRADDLQNKTPPDLSSEGASREMNEKVLRSILVAGRRGFHLARATRQRERLALIEGANAALVETCFLDLQIGAVQRVRRQLLDREANRLGRGAETPIGEPGTLLLANRGGEEFGGGVEVERTQRTHGRGPLSFLALA